MKSEVPDLSESDINYFESRFRPVTVFWRRTVSILHRIHSWENHGKRTGRRKKFMEEVLPLSILGRNLECPGRLISCKYTGRSADADGILRMRGSLVPRQQAEFPVEITTAEPEYEHLQREALLRKGSVFGDPNIRGEGSDQLGNREIINYPSVGHWTQNGTKELEHIARALARKQGIVGKKEMILLINVRPENILQFEDWIFVVRESKELARASGFHDVYLVYIDQAFTFQLYGSGYR